jgi:hypothetical protein
MRRIGNMMVITTTKTKTNMILDVKNLNAEERAKVMMTTKMMMMATKRCSSMG